MQQFDKKGKLDKVAGNSSGNDSGNSSGPSSGPSSVTAADIPAGLSANKSSVSLEDIQRVREGVAKFDSTLATRFESELKRYENEISLRYKQRKADDLEFINSENSPVGFLYDVAGGKVAHNSNQLDQRVSLEILKSQSDLLKFRASKDREGIGHVVEALDYIAKSNPPVEERAEILNRISTYLKGFKEPKSSIWILERYLRTIIYNQL